MSAFEVYASTPNTYNLIFYEKERRPLFLYLLLANIKLLFRYRIYAAKFTQRL